MITLNRHGIGRNVTKYSTRKKIAKTMTSVIKVDDIIRPPSAPRERGP